MFLVVFISFHKFLDLHLTLSQKKKFCRKFSFFNRFTQTPLTPQQPKFAKCGKTFFWMLPNHVRIFCLKFRYSEFIQKHFFKFFWNVQLCLIFMSMSVPPTEKEMTVSQNWLYKTLDVKWKLLILKYGVDWTCTIMHT